MIEQLSLGLTNSGKPRQRRRKGDGPEPTVCLRAPQPVVEALRAVAAQQGITMAVIGRAALIAYARKIEQQAA